MSRADTVAVGLLCKPASRHRPGARFPKNSAAAEIVRALQSGTSTLSEKASARISAETAIRTAQNARVASREKLRSFFTRASLIAEGLDADILRIPVKPSERALIDTGHAFIKDVESMSKDFIKHGVAPEDVSATVEALENAIPDYSNAKASRSVAIEESAKVLRGDDEDAETIRRSRGGLPCRQCRSDGFVCDRPRRPAQESAQEGSERVRN